MLALIDSVNSSLQTNYQAVVSDSRVSLSILCFEGQVDGVQLLFAEALENL